MLSPVNYTNRTDLSHSNQKINKYSAVRQSFCVQQNRHYSVGGGGGGLGDLV